MQTTIPVGFAFCAGYADTTKDKIADSALLVTEDARNDLLDSVDYSFRMAGFRPRQGESILLKPNLLRADALSCTHPALVRAVCQWLLDHGVMVTVGDSPGFGTARGVAEAVGISHALTGLRDHFGNSVTIVPRGLGKSVRRLIPGLGEVRIGRHALEADSIVSLPRLKVHSQMGVTCAVKNLFGCVSGIHKALAHAVHGDKGAERNDFSRLVAAIPQLLPPQAALVDAVVCMHMAGPSGGKPYTLGLIAASSSCTAVDTAIYELLGIGPERLPLWRALREAGIPGAFPHEIRVIGHARERFDCRGFQLPEYLKCHSFHPARLALSAVKRIWAVVQG